MSLYDDRLSQLREHLKDAGDETRNIKGWPSAEARRRFEDVLAYADLVMTATDPSLVSDAAAAGVQSACLQIANNPAVAVQNPDDYGNTLLDAVAKLPSARGRDVEQAVKETGANFQRSVQQRLKSLTADFAVAQESIESFRQAVAEQALDFEAKTTQIRTDLEAELAGRVEAFDARYSELHARIAEEQTVLSTLRTSQTATFEDAEEQRNAAARAALEAAETALRATQVRLTDEMEQRIGEIRRMEMESAQLVGAIGLAGTAERYAEEVKEQKTEADKWRTRTVILALAAALGVIFALVESHPAAETFVGKLTLSVILGGIATYAARQSAYHRQREQRARDLQLELTAFSPFIEPLSVEQQEEERVIMTRKTFGKATVAPAAQEEPGPTALSYALRRREKLSEVS